MVMPLEGIKVLDMSRAWSSWILGDFGADVLKVEAAGPVEGRRAEQAGGAGARQFSREADPYNTLERNKRSIALNLKTTEARDVFYSLTRDADVVLEGLRPGVTKRLGIDYETLSAINPRIIYCAVTGFGQTGPLADLVGHDIAYISQAGALSTVGHPEGKPVVPQNYLADWSGGGLQSVIGIMAAIIAREKTGRGQMVDVSMVDGVVLMMASIYSEYFRDGTVHQRGKALPAGGMPYYSVYECADGKFLSIGCNEPWFFANLCRALGCEQHIPYQHAIEKHDEIRGTFEATFKTKSRDEWFDLLRQTDIVIGKVLEVDEAVKDPHLLAREMVITMDHPELGKVPQIGIATKLSETPGKARFFGPSFGQHTDEVLQSLGYDEAKILDLRERGIVE